jgi:hypothetical protein
MDFTRWWKNSKEFLAICILTFIPLLLNIVFALTQKDGGTDVLYQKVVPAELLAYCVTFISPLFLLFLKTHGKNFQLPAILLIFLAAFIIYVLSLLLIVSSKNEARFDNLLKATEKGFLFWLSVSLVIGSILLRYYTVVQSDRFQSFQQQKNQGENDFTADFKRRLGK